MTGITEMLNSTALTPGLLSLGAGLTVVLLVAALATLRSPVRSRVSSRFASIQASTQPYDVSLNPFRDSRVSTIPLVERLFRGRNWTEETRDMLARAGMPLRVGEYLALRILSVCVALVAGFMIAERIGGGTFARMFFLSVGLGAGALAPPMLVSMRVRKRQLAIETQLVELCEVMASMLQSGYGYAQALTATAAEVGPPLSTELRRLLDTVKLGGDIDQALEDLNTRLRSRDFDMIASAIGIQRRSGGNLAEILQSVASTIRQRQSFFREVRAITSKERFSALFVAAFPLGLIALLTVMAPDPYARLFTDTMGRVILGIALTLDAIGFFIINKLVQIEA